MVDLQASWIIILTSNYRIFTLSTTHKVDSTMFPINFLTRSNFLLHDLTILAFIWHLIFFFQYIIGNVSILSLVIILGLIIHALILGTLFCFQVSSPSVSVFKGYGLSKETEGYLSLHGLKNAVYSIPVADVQNNCFGELVPCPFQVRISASPFFFFVSFLFLDIE